MTRLAFKRVLQQTSPYALLAPAAFILGLACIYPVVIGCQLSFYSWQLGIPWEGKVFVSFGNFITLFRSETFYTILRVTFIFAFTVVISELGLGLALALLLEGKLKGLNIFRSIFLLPMLIAPVVVGLIWRFLYDPYFGLINYLLKLVGVSSKMWLASPSLALPAVIIADIWQWTPFMLILILAGLQSLPADPIEAAVVDGASYFQILTHVKLPLLKPVLGVAVILRLIDAFKVLEVIFNMTFGGPGRSTTVWALQIYKTAFISQRLGMASAYAVVLFFVQLVLSMGLLFIIRPTEVKR